MWVFREAQNLKNCKKALDVCKKSLTHKLPINRAFREIAKKRYTYTKSPLDKSTPQKVVQVADYKDFKKPYKTCVKLILLVLWEAQHVRN